MVDGAAAVSDITMKVPRRWMGIIGLLIGGYLALIWGFHYFPSQDGPSHLGNSRILLHYHEAGATGELYRRYYQLNPRFEPNLAGHYLLAGLMALMPPLIAEKILLSLYVVAVPLSVWLCPSAMGLATTGRLLSTLLVFPLIFNVFVMRGFYNFSLGIPVYLLILGYWLRHRHQPTPMSRLIVALALLLLYTCHIVPVVLWCLTAAITTVCDSFVANNSGGGFSPKLWRGLLQLAMVTTPALVAVGFFLLHKHEGIVSVRLPATVLVKRFFGMKWLVSHRRNTQGAVAAAMAVVLGVMTILALKMHAARPNDWSRQALSAKGSNRKGWMLSTGMMVATAITACLYAIAPDSASGGSFLNDRLALYCALSALLWFGSVPWSVSTTHWLCGVALVLAIAAPLPLISSIARVNSYLSEYTSLADQLPAGATFVHLCFSTAEDQNGKRMCSDTDPFAHMGGYLAARKDLVDLENYEAGLFDYFPTLFRASLNPQRYLSQVYRSMEHVPPCVRLLDYPKLTGAPVDYVILWGVMDSQRNDPCTVKLMQDLQEGYEQVLVTKPRGSAVLYRRRNLKPPGPTR